MRSATIKSPSEVSYTASGGGWLARNVKGVVFLKRDKKYKRDYPHRLYVYFASYQEPLGAPSFTKFARSIGVTREDVEAFREHKEFERAYRECTEIRRDYLIDNALSKRFDSSFVKFLLSDGAEADSRAESGDGIEFTLRVLSEGDEA